MIRRQGHVPTPEASRYLQRLCFHFSKKIPATWDEVRGQAQFAWGRCDLRAGDDALHFDCTADDEASLARVQHVVDAHVALFSRKNPMAVVWDAPQDAGGSSPSNSGR